MLLLSRKRNQKVIINDNIVIEVKSITRNNVRLGISAPAEYTILRDELKRHREQSNQDTIDVELED